MEPLLSVRDLQIQFRDKRSATTAVDHISFSVEKGRVLGIVGESGCGKSVTSLSILRLLGENAVISDGSIRLEGRELTKLTEQELCRIRGNEIAMIFQDPMTALNPTMTVGRQLMEPLMLHQGQNRRQAWQTAVETLRRVGISAPEKRMREYPHQLSGGMRQRVMIAIAVSCAPKLLIADEPTTALDVTIQAQILDLMQELRRTLGTAIILITHDMGVVAENADDVLVLYAGRVAEYGPAEEVLRHPRHPYTRGLLASIPPLDRDVETLYNIEGTVPSAGQMPDGCHFAPRCPHATPRCHREPPPPVRVGGCLVNCFEVGGEPDA